MMMVPKRSFTCSDDILLAEQIKSRFKLVNTNDDDTVGDFHEIYQQFQTPSSSSSSVSNDDDDDDDDNDDSISRSGGSSNDSSVIVVIVVVIVVVPAAPG